MLTAARLLRALLYLAAPVLTAHLFSAPLPGPFTVSDYQLVRQTPITRTVTEFEYRATVTNLGSYPAASVTGNVQTLDPAVQLVQTYTTWDNVPAGQSVVSTTTFTFRIDRTAVFNSSNLVWTFTSRSPVPPVANAGPNQKATLGSLVHLNGTASSDPQASPLSYLWSFSSLPPNCMTAIDTPTSVTPSFVATCVGDFAVQLVVTNALGLSSSPSVTFVSTDAVPPSANAGPAQKVALSQPGQIVGLDGSGSVSPGGLPLTYRWSFTGVPSGSQAQLLNSTTVSPSFAPDVAGDYRVQLVVNNGVYDSPPSVVVISTYVATPTANAGPDQKVRVGSLVQLDGSRSTQLSNYPITYWWSIATKPEGSTATLSDARAVNPTFTADKPGTYVASLYVTSGGPPSNTDAVVISTEIVPPVANAGPDTTAPVGSLVTLNGANSFDPNGLPLSYSWALVSRPPNSEAALSGAESPTPTLLLDQAGQYVAQLVVNNGQLSSTPDTVLLSTSNVAPTAEAGPDQHVALGSTVQLNGLGSTSPSQEPLSYSWSFNALPKLGAVFSNPASATPTFTADAEGVYVAQLIVSDTHQSSIPDTVQILVEGNKTIQLSAPTKDLWTLHSETATLNISGVAPEGGLTIRLQSSNTARIQVPPSVVIPAGASGTNFTITAGTTPGAASVTPVATGYSGPALTLTVIQGSMTINTSAPLVGRGESIDGAVTLVAAAPPEGLVVSLKAQNPNVTLSTSTLTFSQGETTKPFSVTGVSPGSATLTASAPGLDIVSTTVTCTVNIITLPSALAVGVGQTVSYPVGLAQPAPVGGVVVTLHPDDASVARISPETVAISQGQTAPAIPPTVTGLKIGTAAITASAPGYASGLASVVVQPPTQFYPSLVQLSVASVRLLTVVLPSPAPANGYTFTLLSSDPSKVTTISSLTIPAGATRGDVSITGVAVGTAQITASGPPGVAPFRASVSVTAAPTIAFAYYLGKLGRNLEGSMTVILTQPAPPGNLIVSLKSSGSNLLFARSTMEVGSNLLTVTIPAGQTASVPVVVRNIGADTGSEVATASASGYQPNTATIAFTRSGFVFSNAYSHNLFVGKTVAMPAYLAPLDDDGKPILSTGQVLRSDSPPVALNLASSSPSVAAISTSAIVSPGRSDAVAYVTGLSAGQATLTAYAPTDFSLPASGTTFGIVVTVPSLLLNNASVGYNMQIALPVTLQVPAPPGGVDITFATDNSFVALSPSPSEQGSKAVVIHANEGITSVMVWVQNLGASEGSAMLTASAPGNNTTTTTVSLLKSGFSTLQSSSSQTIARTSAPVQLSVVPRDDSGRATALRPGVTVELTLLSSDRSVLIPSSPISCTNQTCVSSVLPLKAGSAFVSVVQPAGYVASPGDLPQRYDVIEPAFTNNGDALSVGYNLMAEANSFYVSDVVTATSPLVVTVTSGSGKLAISLDPKGTGSPTVQLIVPQGSSKLPPLYLQNLGTDNDTASLTLSASGFSAQFDVALVPATFAWAAPSLTLTTGSSAVTWIYSYKVVGILLARQGIRPGVLVDIQLSQNAPPVLSLPNTVHVNPQGGSAGVTILAEHNGSTAVTFVQPPGFGSSTSTTTHLGVSVVAPPPPILSTQPSQLKIGSNLQMPVSILLGTQLPYAFPVMLTSPRRDVVFTTDPNSVGLNPLQAIVPAGQSSFTVYVQNAGFSLGNTEMTVSAPGVSSATTSISLVPSGFALSGQLNQPIMLSLSSGSTSLPLVGFALDPSWLFVVSAQFLRGGFTQAIPLVSSNPTVAETQPAISLSGNTNGVVPIVARSLGTSVISVVQPDGYFTPEGIEAATIDVVP